MSLPMAEGGNQMNFKVPFNSKHSVILWFSEFQQTAALLCTQKSTRTSKKLFFPTPGDAAGVWSTSAHYLSTLIPLNRTICFHLHCKHICLSAPALQLRRAHTRSLEHLSLGIVCTWKKGREIQQLLREKKKGSQAFTSLTAPKIMLLPWRMNVLISDLQNPTERLLLPCQKSILRSFWMPGPCQRTSWYKKAAESHLLTDEKSPNKKFRRYTFFKKKVSFGYSELYVATSLFCRKAHMLKSWTLKSAPASSFLVASNEYFEQNPASAWDL